MRPTSTIRFIVDVLDDRRYDNEFQISESNFKPPRAPSDRAQRGVDHDEVQPTRGIFIRQKASRRVFTPSPRQTRVTGDKATRFGAFSAQAEPGNVDILRGDWNESWFTALEAFPEAAHDDDVDFLDLQELQSEAVVNLSQRQKTTGPIGIARLPRHKPQSQTIEIMPHQRRIRHANLHVFAILNQTAADSGIP
jgi:hypothetical protein